MKQVLNWHYLNLVLLAGLLVTVGGSLNAVQASDIAVDLGSGVNMEFVLIPAGSFIMGSNGGEDDEKPEHEVTVGRPFYMGKCEVTQAQWKAVMGAPPTMSPWRKVLGPDYPVEQANWNDAQAFLDKLGKIVPDRVFRLPTEAEWEYACRAGNQTNYSCGDDENMLQEFAWYAGNSDGHTHPVGQKKPNDFGLFDMHGNVWELCQSEYRPYSYRSDDGREALDAKGSRVVRGGSYMSGPSYMRSAFRYDCKPDAGHFSTGYVGFRVVIPVDSH